MAMRSTAPAVTAPGTQEQATRGSQVVNSVPMFLLLQHQMIDQAENEVQSYRRLISHIELEGPLTIRALKRKGLEEEARQADDAMLRFRNRPSPYGSTIDFVPLDSGDMYRIRVVSPISGNGPWKSVHGPDLPAARDTLLIPSREHDFERAGLEPSGIHSQLHDWLDLVGLMQFDSAYSNMAKSVTAASQAKEVERLGELRRTREESEVEALGPTTPDKSKRPPGRNGNDGVPDWASAEEE
jgi:hypothetical protein